MRRVSDQNIERQYAKVSVDGVAVTEYNWLFADSNTYKRWLEDEFVIPSGYIKGKDKVKINIIPIECSSKINFNIFELKIYAVNA